MFDNRADVIRRSCTQNMSDNKSNRTCEIKLKTSLDRTKWQLKTDTPTVVKQNVCTIIDRRHIFRNSCPRPTLLELSRRNYNVVRGRPLLTHQELLQNKLLSQELTARLAEARLALLGPDAAQEGPEMRPCASRKKSQKQHQPPHRVSFLSVSKRVANIIRFRQAAQNHQPDSLIEKENSTLEAAENLPKTPRFSSYMSAAAQYALMKGYEDVIFEKLASKFPESTTILKRNKTPHHSIAISDKSNIAEKLRRLNSNNSKNLKNCTENEFSMNSVRQNGNKKEPDDETKEAIKLETLHSPGQRPECKGEPQDAPGKVYDEINKITRYEPPESVDKSTTSFLPDISKPGQKIRLSAQNTQCPPKHTHRATLFSTGHFPEILSLTSPEAVRRDRRIALSYRIEHAMDILDTIKTKSEQTLSPRVKGQTHRHIAPLRDFNRWTDQWASEFHSDAVK